MISLSLCGRYSAADALIQHFAEKEILPTGEKLEDAHFRDCVFKATTSSGYKAAVVNAWSEESKTDIQSGIIPEKYQYEQFLTFAEQAALGQLTDTAQSLITQVKRLTEFHKLSLEEQEQRFQAATAANDTDEINFIRKNFPWI